MSDDEKIEKMYIQIKLMKQSLDNVETQVSKLSESDTANKIDIATLKTQSIIWGGFSGGIATFIVSVLAYFVTQGE